MSPRFDRGWIKVWRGAWEKDLSTNIHLWAIWHALLHLAHWRESSIVWEGEKRVLPAGSVILGVKEIASRFRCSQRTISKWLKYLAKTDRIVLETCSRGTLVTICNWESYQAKDTGACANDSLEVLDVCEPSRNEIGLIEEIKNEERRSKPDVERNRSSVGAIGEFLGNPLAEEALRQVPHKTQRTWLLAYPDTEWLKQEILKAVSWLEVNPRRKPKVFARFFGNWLSRGWEKYRKTIPASSVGINTTPIPLEDCL